MEVILEWYGSRIINTNIISFPPDGGGAYQGTGAGTGVGSAPTGEPEYAEDGGGAAGNGDTQDTEEEEEEKLIIDPSVPPCVQAIIAQLMEKANLSLIPDISNSAPVSHLSQIILDLFSASQQYHLNIQVAPLGSQANAQTTVAGNNPVTGQFTFNMTLGAEYVANATTLGIARTIIHESLHALLGYLTQTDATSSFVQLLNDYRINHSTDDNQDLGEHEFMTQFAEAIGHSLAVWDNHQLPQSYYNNLAWSGDMQNTQAFQSLPLEQQQAAINAVTAEGQANAPATANAQGTPCNQ